MHEHDYTHIFFLIACLLFVIVSNHIVSNQNMISIYSELVVDASICLNVTLNQCDENAVCRDLAPGSYLCTCKQGFVGDGFKCSG